MWLARNTVIKEAVRSCSSCPTCSIARFVPASVPEAEEAAASPFFQSLIVFLHLLDTFLLLLGTLLFLLDAVILDFL